MRDYVEDIRSHAEIDELDLALINALQLDSRAPWSIVGKALGVDAATVARRWTKLVDAGAAWIAVYPGGPQVSAFIEVDCESSRVGDVASMVSTWPQVITVERTSGGRDLLLTVGVPSLAALSRPVLEGIGALDGVRATRTHLISKPYVVGGDWQIRALDAEQRAQMGSRGRSCPGTQQPLDNVERQIVGMLSDDARTSLTDLGAGLGCSVSTARRRLQSMIASRSVILRCDLAQPLSGYGVAMWLWCQVSAVDSEAVASRLAQRPETRSCFGVTGSSTNFLYCTWLRSLDDAHRLEEWLASSAPSLKIADRTIVLGYAKRMGRLIEHDGRSKGAVPVDVW